ncbi:MAG: hypothetical protein OEU92_19020 [Alphaproteobacteria bacterium]|nr:hypothetical protein [Alphaproteobacteria bacterium]
METAVDGFDESAWQSVIPESSPAGHMESEPLDEVGHQQPDDGDTEAGVAYPLTGSFTVGVSYGLEEMEDLSKGHIESGTVSEDYENHTVLLRANWRFN